MTTEDVYIRLTENETGFVCTVRDGMSEAKSTEFVLEDHPIMEPAEELVRTRARS
jgi:hypothetical protein